MRLRVSDRRTLPSRLPHFLSRFLCPRRTKRPYTLCGPSLASPYTLFTLQFDFPFFSILICLRVAFFLGEACKTPHWYNKSHVEERNINWKTVFSRSILSQPTSQLSYLASFSSLLLISLVLEEQLTLSVISYQLSTSRKPRWCE